ncbi:MAG: nucleotidyltransferase domain-containing protein, partial [Bacteroidetes bacterium]|nr:nucleotidyltransferase domain-containing protein [Bacteroidota bacterium]
MERREEILDILRREIPFISQTYRVKRVGVFGSFAKNSANDQSDIDIVVEFEKPIGLKFVSLAEYLE